MFFKSKICVQLPWQILILLFMALPVCAYELQYANNNQKTPLRWKNKIIKLTLSSSLHSEDSETTQNIDFEKTLERSLSTWEQATGIKFVVAWTDQQSVSIAENGDGVNLITIAATPENMALFNNEAEQATARTRIFFNKNNFITEADIVLNPTQLFSIDGKFKTFDLEATLTHEIGHLVGLNHSAALSATMYDQQGQNGTFGMPSFGPRTLSEDDLAGARVLYDADFAKESCCGQIFGSIQDADGKPLAGWNIWVEELSTGRLNAVVTSKKSGAFQISSLKTGRYRIFAQSATQDFYAELIGEVTIEPDKIANVTRQFALRPRNLKTSVVGYNGQLSSLPITLLRATNVHLILFGGENYYFADFAVGKISTNSPFLVVDQTSLSIQDLNTPISVFSFEIQVEQEAKAGDYNLVFQKQNGDFFASLGCFSVEN